MNLENFPFNECLKRSQCKLIIEIVCYLAKEENIVIEKIDQETDHIVFWVFHPKYSRPEHGMLIQITDDTVYKSTTRIKSNTFTVLEYYEKIGFKVNGISFSVRINGIP